MSWPQKELRKKYHELSRGNNNVNYRQVIHVTRHNGYNNDNNYDDNANSRCVSYLFPLIFFFECDPLRLRNTPTRFQEAMFNGCRDMLKVDENGVISIHGAFFIRFP